MLSEFLFPSIWFKNNTDGKSILISSELTEDEVVDQLEPNEVFSLSYLKKRYPDYYSSDSNWYDFFEIGISKGHIPSGLFEEYLKIIAKTGVLVEPNRSSHLWDFLKPDNITTAGYISTLFAATNQIMPLEYFNPIYYYEHNRDILEGEFPAHIHFMLSGCYHGRQSSTLNFPEILTRIPTKTILKEVDEIQRGISAPVLPEVPLQFIIAHTPVGKDWRTKISDIYERDIKDAKQDAIERSQMPAKGVVDNPYNLDEFISEIRDSGEFDLPWFLSRNPDIARSEFDPIWHYVMLGEAEGRWPNPSFDPSFYLRVNSDVRAAKLNAFIHFLRSGRAEGRLPCQTINERSHVESSETVLFIGHDAILAGAQRVLLDIVEWTFNHTNRRIAIILLGPGLLSQHYARFGKTLVINDPETEHQLIAEFLSGERVSFVYANTVVSGKFFTPKNIQLIRGAPVVAHIHELENVIRHFEKDFMRLKSQAMLWICASEPTSKHLVDHWELAPETVKTIHAFIKLNVDKSIPDSRKAARSELSLSPETTVIVGCGTVYERKGSDVFVATALEYLRTNSNTNVKFLWIGDGPDRARLENFIKEAGYSKDIEFLGFRSNANELIACADLFFLSSREDPFPLVCLEAAQYEVPTLCIRGRTGMTDFIEDDAGFIEDSLEFRVLADAISHIVQNKDDRHSRGKIAREKLLVRHTRDLSLLKIEQFLWRAATSPFVAAIVPNYNHELYLRERLNSIISQDLKNIEILILDDLSTDGSREVISAYIADPRVTTIFNKENSGGVFRQWQKGFSNTSAQLIWIAESDDSAECNFLSCLVGKMVTDNVVLSFCTSVIMRADGEKLPGILDEYLNRAERLDFKNSFQMPGAEFVRRGFGALCTIVNASSVVMRRDALESSLKDAQSFRMCGDWFIYLNCLRNGDVYYTNATTSYFRRHEKSAVHLIEGTDLYFSERLKIANTVAKLYRLDEVVVGGIVSELQYEIERFNGRYSFDGNKFLSSLKESLGRRATPLNRSKLAFYVHGMMFSTGGIERLAAQLCNYLCHAGFDVTIFCAPGGHQPVYPVTSGVNICPVLITSDKDEKEFSVVLADGRFNLMIPMLSEHLFEHVIRASNVAGIKVLASEHNDPWVIEKKWWDKSKRHEFFSRCDAIHLLLPKFEESLPLDTRPRSFIIPNGVDLLSFSSDRRIKKEKRIITVGRLSDQKRMDLLISSFALISEEFPEWSLHIFGEGELSGQLGDQIKDVDLQDRIFLRGVSKDLHTEYNRSLIFGLTSDFEGFGIVVVEALACGLPVIAFEDCNGPNEIVRDGVDGLLVKERSAVAFASGLREIIINNDLRMMMSLNAQARAQSYDLSLILSSWEQLINSLVQQ